MRLRELQLTAFGPFTDAVIPFGAAGACDLHVVLGRNEAGKSTTLRAIDALLFGFPHRISETQIHPAGKLRVGALIEAVPDAPARALARVRGNVRTLRDGTDEVVDDAVMQALLGAIEPALYRRLFLVTQEELREGGRGLLSGGGELGVSVFGATLGAGNLAGVTAQLKEIASRLFSPNANATKPLLNASLHAYHELFEAARELAIAPADYEHANELVAELAAARERQRKTIDELARQRASLQRLASVSGLLARRRVLQDELAGLGTLPELAADAVTQRELAGAAKVKAAGELREHRARRDELLARVRLTDLTGLEPVRDEQGRPQVDPVGTEVTDSINRAADNNVKLTEQARRAAEDLAGAEQKRADAAAALQAAGSAPAPAIELEQFTAALRATLPEIQTAQKQREIVARQSDQLERDLAALEPVLTLEQLRTCQPPAAALIERHEAAFERLATRLKELGDERKRLQAQHDDGQLRLAAASTAGLAELTEQRAAARADRDKLLTALGRELEQGRVEMARAIYVPLQAAVPAADRFSDALLARGGQVAEHERLAAELEDLAGKIKGHDDEIAQLIGERGEAQRQWRALWSGSGFEPLDEPAPMRHWHEQFTALRARALELDQQRQAQDERIAEGEMLAEAVRAQLARGGEQIDRRLPAAQLLDRAQAVIDDVQARIAEHEALARTLQERTTAVEDAQKKERQARQAIDVWTKEWNELLAPLPLTGESSPPRVRDLVTRLNALAGLLAQLREQEAQIAARQRELGQADERLAALCAAAGCKSVDELPAIERAVLDRNRKREQLGELEAQIVERGERPIPELERELAGRGNDEIAAELDAVGRDLETARGEQEQLIERHTRAEQARDELDHGADAARARDRAEQQASIAGEQAWSYLSAKAAQILLEQAIAYHREHSASPIVTRAEELVRQLTAGSLQRLLVDEMTPGQPMLVARRGSGEELTVDALSEGTRDQLYLALRLAALEHHLSVRPPLPLLLDDILVDSDDERLAAALPALASIAERTQVILLTHHQHVATTAEHVLGDRVRVHRLGA
jgi:uncharacterized protein YhaN